MARHQILEGANVDVSFAASALRNLPYELRILRLEALVEASESLNRCSGLDDILHVILHLVSVQLDCERATAFLRDKRTEKLHARHMTGSEHIDIILDRGVGIAGFVADNGESVIINDVQRDERFDRTTDRRTGFVTHTMICVPLRNPEGALMGALQAINSRGGGFSDADLTYFESFAAVAAVAVEREQLAQEAHRADMLSAELNLARKIQQRLLPPTGIVELPAPFSAWGSSKPCYDVGGDAYDVLILPSGECAFWVADVSGKGIGAALLMSTLQTELHAFVRSENELGRLAAELNARVTDVAPLGTYATLFLGIVTPDTGRLRYINAGHIPPVWINSRPDEERTFVANGMPIGFLPGSQYEPCETMIAMGERLAIFSDGVTEAVDLGGIQYDQAGLAESLAKLRSDAVDKIGEQFLADLDRFRMGAPAGDDTTLLVLGRG